MSKWSFFLAILLVFISCRPNRVPRVIAKEIKVFSSDSPCADAAVKEMRFQGKTVYLFETGNCKPDKDSRVLDKKGKLLGALGGFVGNTMILGEDFSKAEFAREVWRNKVSVNND